MLQTKNAFLVFLFSDRKTAAEGLVQLFLEKEENARREETKAGMKLSNILIIIFLKEYQYTLFRNKKFALNLMST